ncbi:Succinate dehydrogenase/fumarate reductase, cytochrome b subunit [Actinomyces bovis]|uniref:Succinate dehydrogenase/fumarate reductase, cytochrome b subunit n=1 Tax=Actinomyces bovis TaxID=1658 RepID=A0ABY1VN29_9ACTO|nr:succinate dehydrogenase cytochrome b subunit [Actinomyces bovis]SPT53228.1 Succinate dehydrogenase/fumarate reductase, cytochrome b subunit [Actinomyces bovis]VEG52471.1 Succinate dehydrogenase/fumarate reductase, cytochrome b subunit [Actinomyces israelii]
MPSNTAPGSSRIPKRSPAAKRAPSPHPTARSTTTHATKPAPSAVAIEPIGDAPAAPPRRRHRFSFTVLKTTMAVTGTALALFVAVHMFGNLKAFAGPQAYNAYAVWLREALHPLLPVEGLLWLMRLVLGTCLLLHVAAGVTLWLRGRAARGTHRRQGMRLHAVATGSMLLTGALIGFFVLVHLLDLTIGALVAPSAYTPPAHTGGTLQISAYQNLVASLSRPGMAMFYTAVMLGLSLHLSQGLWNVVIDLGGTGLRLRQVFLVVAHVAALLVVLINGALPLLVLTGVIA